MNNGHKIADIVVDLPAGAINYSYQYLIPEKLRPMISLGSTALVPFAGRNLIGYVVGLTDTSRHNKLSEIIEIIEEPPVFNSQELELFKWMSEYYLAPLGDCLKLMVPPGRIRHLRESYHPNPEIKESCPEEYLKIYNVLKDLRGPIEKKDILKLTDLTGLKKLLKNKIINKKYAIIAPKVKDKTVSLAALNIENDRGSLTKVRGEKQRQILAMLAEHGEVETGVLLKRCQAKNSSLSSLIKKGLIKITKVNVHRDPDLDYLNRRAVFNLTEDQEEAVTKIHTALEAPSGEIFLLEGVTGSGKTEVYLEAIAKAMLKGKGAILLVPEIALTSQLTERFRQRFNDQVAVLHSGLGLGERYDQWQKINRGEARIVIGARSALFAPVQNLGLIVIDEEHETSYKQNRSPRYHVREVAAKMAKIHQAILILGSATPSLETKLKAGKALVNHLTLPRRVSGRQLPAISLVDMRDEPVNSVFSSQLKQAMDECLAKKEKMIIFLNRRGYSSFLLCRDCGYVPKCRNCSVSLTYHQREHRLICHHCRFSQAAPSLCPKCHGHHLRYFGMGTQKVEQELNTIYPETPVIRMDADTTAQRDAHRQKLIAFAKQPVAILLGTQMVAKGLDFPEVSLIGIVNADTALNLPDFRAAERTFQLIMQVAGRSGRGNSPGNVIIQTYNPENYAIVAASQGKFREFYRQELEFRRELNYPPYTQMINLIISGHEENKVASRANNIAAFLNDHLDKTNTRIYGPGSAPIPKIKNRWRWHIILTTTEADGLKLFLKENWNQFGADKSTGVIADVDPVWLL